MKKSILVFTLLFSFSFAVSSQTATTVTETTCYTEWAKLFEKRGAKEVTDGIYTNVIITIRSGDEADCFDGKCEVKGGVVVAMYIKLEDGKYELLKRKARFDVPITINNGMSKVFLTLEDDLINVLFVGKINPKKAKYSKAKGPSDI